MKILHTSDWHLGRTLEGRSRIPEQREFIEELKGILDEEGIDLVIVAGDVFDTYNPSAAAEELFFQALEELAQGGKRAIVVIAGNHDNPERLRASNPLACKQGIYLFGLPGEDVSRGPRLRTQAEMATSLEGDLEELDEGPIIVDGGPGWIEIRIPTCERNVILSLLPYPSERRLNEILTGEFKEKDFQKAYSKRVALAFQEGGRHFRSDTVNIAVSHLFVSGGISTHSERDIQLGGAFAVQPTAIPANAHYTALGHLHKFQEVKGTKSPCYYSGSPLYYSFTEHTHQKYVIKVEVDKKGETLVTPIPIYSGRPMHIKEFSSYEEAYKWCEAEENQNKWLHIKIKVEEALSNEKLEALNEIHKGIIYRRTNFSDGEEENNGVESLEELTLRERFERFALRQTGRKAEEEIVNLFLELVAMGGEED